MYFEADSVACYNSFRLAPGISREALAVWTPIGLLQPTVLPFGQKNSGTEAQGLLKLVNTGGEIWRDFINLGIHEAVITTGSQLAILQVREFSSLVGRYLQDEVDARSPRRT